MLKGIGALEYHSSAMLSDGKHSDLNMIMELRKALI